MNELNQAWSSFCDDENNNLFDFKMPNNNIENHTVPKSSDLYISTQTKISYLTMILKSLNLNVIKRVPLRKH